MMTKAKRRRALDLVSMVEGHCALLRNKLAGPMTEARLADVEEQLKMAKADIDEALSIVRAAEWRTRTGPAEWLGPKREATR